MRLSITANNLLRCAPCRRTMHYIEDNSIKCPSCDHRLTNVDIELLSFRNPRVYNATTRGDSIIFKLNEIVLGRHNA